MRYPTARVFAASLALFAAACGGAQGIPADAKVTITSLVQVDCSDCGERIVADLRERPGVYKAVYDRRKAEVIVTASPSFDVYTHVKSLAANEGFVALLGAGKGAYQPERVFPNGADVAFPVKDGEDVPDLGAFAVKGKVTVVDFAATWCGPCRQLDKHVADLLATHPDLAYRRLDVGDWDTPLALHYLKKVPMLPFAVVYGKTGAKVSEVVGLDLQKLDRAIVEGAGR